MESEHDIEPKRGLKPTQPCGDHELERENGETNERALSTHFGDSRTIGRR
jgi:hypothetical protein